MRFYCKNEERREKGDVIKLYVNKFLLISINIWNSDDSMI